MMRTRPVNGALIAEIAVWMLIAVGMWAYSYRFDSHIPNFALGPVVWPRVILVLIAFCAIALGISQCGSMRGITKVEPASASGPGALAPGAPLVFKLVATFGLPLLYVWLLPRAGFFATTPFFVAGYMYVFGQRHPVHLIATALSIYAVVTVIFSKLLFLPLPVGVWPGFYDFSNALLVFLGNV